MYKHTCGAVLHLENIGGLVVYRIVKRTKVYRGRCPKCGITLDIKENGKPLN